MAGPGTSLAYLDLSVRSSELRLFLDARTNGRIATTICILLIFAYLDDSFVTTLTSLNYVVHNLLTNGIGLTTATIITINEANYMSLCDIYNNQCINALYWCND